MYQLKLEGTLTSKYAAHVPVIRKWKLVWERREFGTRVDEVLEVFPLRFTTWENIPVGGVTLEVVGDFDVRVKRVIDRDPANKRFSVVLLYNGIEVPGTYKVLDFPFANQYNLFEWKTSLWKGVKVDADVLLEWQDEVSDTKLP